MKNVLRDIWECHIIPKLYFLDIVNLSLTCKLYYEYSIKRKSELISTFYHDKMPVPVGQISLTYTGIEQDSRQNDFMNNVEYMLTNPEHFDPSVIRCSLNRLISSVSEKHNISTKTVNYYLGINWWKTSNWLVDRTMYHDIINVITTPLYKSLIKAIQQNNSPVILVLIEIGTITFCELSSHIYGNKNNSIGIFDAIALLAKKENVDIVIFKKLLKSTNYTPFESLRLASVLNEKFSQTKKEMIYILLNHVKEMQNLSNNQEFIYFMEMNGYKNLVNY